MNEALTTVADLYRQSPRKSDLIAAARLSRRRSNREVLSADHTPISARCVGTGPPLLFVHGALGDRDTFVLLVPALRGRFTVWTYDRRGRGGSGDSMTYSLDREVEDLLAVIDAVGEPPHVVAHSFGAGCALLAARCGASMRSLTLYEPPLHQDRTDQEAVARVGAAVARGDLDGALWTFFRDVADTPASEVSGMQSMRPAWNRLRSGARVLPRELDAIKRWRWTPDRWAVQDVPVLLIAGSETRHPVFPTFDELQAAVPDAETTALAGQGHLAMAFAPAALTQAISAFVDRH